MTSRSTFPPRRAGQAFAFQHDGLGYHAVANRLPNGELAEIFIDAGKVGSTAHTMGKESAVLFSLARQHGCPLSVIRSALPLLHDGGPAGPIGVALAIAEQGT